MEFVVLQFNCIWSSWPGYILQPWGWWADRGEQLVWSVDSCGNDKYLLFLCGIESQGRGLHTLGAEGIFGWFGFLGWWHRERIGSVSARKVLKNGRNPFLMSLILFLCPPLAPLRSKSDPINHIYFLNQHDSRRVLVYVADCTPYKPHIS